MFAWPATCADVGVQRHASSLLSALPLTSSSQPTALSCHIQPLPPCSYGPQWEAHVLSNLPFYLTLLPLFLEASVPRVEVHARVWVCSGVAGES